jgi:hypothetical protein
MIAVHRDAANRLLYLLVQGVLAVKPTVLLHLDFFRLLLFIPSCGVVAPFALGALQDYDISHL